MEFKLWLESDNAHPDDQFESLVADTIYNLLDKSIKMYFQNGKQTKLSEIIQQIAGKQADYSTGKMEITIPSSIKGVELPKHFFQHGPLKVVIEPSQGNLAETGASYGYGKMYIAINTKTLSQAQEYNDPNVQKMMVKIQYQLHHEATHISSAQVGNNAKNQSNPYLSKSHPQGSPEYNKGKIDYYTDPGELRAHAKQFAVMYKRFYPNQPFDMQKMLALDGHSGKIRRFFQGLNSGEHWNMDASPYKDQMQQAGAKFNQLIDYFMKHS